MSVSKGIKKQQIRLKLVWLKVNLLKSRCLECIAKHEKIGFVRLTV